jgi:hypothetical protein
VLNIRGPKGLLGEICRWVQFLEEAGRGARTGVRPGDEFVEGLPDLVRFQVAVTFAMDVLLDEIAAEAGRLNLTAVKRDLRDGNDGIVDSVERQHGAAEAPGGRVVAQ